MQEAWRAVGAWNHVSRVTVLVMTFVIAPIMLVLGKSVLGLNTGMALIFALALVPICTCALLAVFWANLCTPKRFYQQHLLLFLEEREYDVAGHGVSYGLASIKMLWERGEVDYTLVVNFDRNVLPALATLYRSDDDLPKTVARLGQLDRLIDYANLPHDALLADTITT